MNAWKVGSVAMVTDLLQDSWLASKDEKGWNSLDPKIGFVPDDHIEDARPILLIDPVAAESTPESILRLAAKALDDGRSGYETEAGHLRDWADQIEKQTRAPLAEPDVWGVVEASCVHNPRRWHWMRHEDGNWWPFAPYGQDDKRPMPDDWDSLVDPVLIREGVTP